MTTDPARLPADSTWSLLTNLPHPDAPHAASSSIAPAGLAEIARLYGLRTWVEQGYKQLKQELGWADWQVRADRAIRRHWVLVCGACSCCWWAWSRAPDEHPAPGRGKTWPAAELRADRPNVSWPVALRRVQAWLRPRTLLWRWWRAWSALPPPPPLQALLDWLWSGRPIDGYVR